MVSSNAKGLVIIITGLSGSGKSTALNALEDNGFFCIDNLPILLLPKFLALRQEADAGFMKLGVVMDVREPEITTHYQSVFAQVRAMGYELKLVFMEADPSTLVKRFSETRRPHPLATDGNLAEGLAREREFLSPLRTAASDILDTTKYNIHKLREVVEQKYAHGFSKEMVAEIISFGFKHGLPTEADLVFDVRFLPNPFYLDELRELDGRDSRVIEYVFSSEEARVFLSKITDLFKYLLPLYRREGRSYLAVAIGCTGGHHRSVAMAGQLWKNLVEAGLGPLSIRHRDVPPGGDLTPGGRAAKGAVSAGRPQNSRKPGGKSE